MNLTREPLAVRAAIVAAITAMLHVLVVTGVLPIEPDAEVAIAGAVDLVGTAVLVVWSRGAVTPVADPRLPESEGSSASTFEPPVPLPVDDIGIAAVEVSGIEAEEVVVGDPGTGPKHRAED